MASLQTETQSSVLATHVQQNTIQYLNDCVNTLLNTLVSLPVSRCWLSLGVSFFLYDYQLCSLELGCTMRG